MSDLESKYEMLYAKLPVNVSDKLTSLVSALDEEEQEQMIDFGLVSCFGLNEEQQLEMVEMFEKYSAIEGFDILLQRINSNLKLRDIIKQLQDEKTYNLLMDSNKPENLFLAIRTCNLDLERTSEVFKKFKGDDLESITSCYLALGKTTNPILMREFYQMLDKYDKDVTEFARVIEESANKPAYVLSLEQLFTEHSDRKCIREAAEAIREAKDKSQAAEIISETFDALDKYKEKYELYKGIAFFLNYTKNLNTDYAKGIVNNCKKNPIREFIEKHGTEKTIQSVLNMRTKVMPDILDRAIEISGKYENSELLFEALNVVASKKNANTVETYCKIFEKYLDNNSGSFVKLILERKKVDAFDFDELLSDRCYNLVKKAKDPYEVINKIAIKFYSSIRNCIDDRKFAEKLDYNDLDILNSAGKFAIEIHKHKSSDLQWQIRKGFKNELNRAIAQGHDYKSKLQNLKRFCYEVKKGLRDNAYDLMVMHYG